MLLTIFNILLQHALFISTAFTKFSEILIINKLITVAKINENHKHTGQYRQQLNKEQLANLSVEK